jgi:hypothetical protein
MGLIEVALIVQYGSKVAKAEGSFGMVGTQTSLGHSQSPFV